MKEKIIKKWKMARRQDEDMLNNNEGNWEADELSVTGFSHWSINEKKKTEQH